MALNSAPNGTVPQRPFSLYGEGIPREGAEATAREQGQLALSPEISWQEKGARLRALLNRAIVANQITMPEIERNTGVDEKQAARALKDGGGAHPPLPLVAYLLWNDERAVILEGIASALGYEIRRKEPDLAAENRRLRARLAKLEAVLSEDP